MTFFKISRPIFVANLIVLLVSLYANPALASLCINPQNEAERTVCESAELKIIEELISKSYFDKKASLSPMEQKEIARDQKLWRSFLKNCKSDKNCIRDAFNQRLTEIQDFDKVVKKEEESDDEGAEEEEGAESDEDASDEDEDEADEEKNADKKNLKNKKTPKGKSSKKSTKGKAAKSAGDTKADVEETEGAKDDEEEVDEEETEEETTEKTKSSLSFLQRFSNWLFPSKKEMNPAPKPTNSSSLKTIDEDDLRYLTLQSDMEKNSKSAKETTQKTTGNNEIQPSDFEADSKTQDLQDLAAKEDGTSDLAAQTDLQDATSVNEVDVKSVKVDDGVEQVSETAQKTVDDLQKTTEQMINETKDGEAQAEHTEKPRIESVSTDVLEEEQPSFFSRVMNFFSFGTSESEDTKTETATKEVIDPSSPADEEMKSAENDSAEVLGDLANEMDETNLKQTDDSVVDLGAGAIEKSTVSKTTKVVKKTTNPVQVVKVTKGVKTVKIRKKGLQPSTPVKNNTETKQNNKTVQNPFVQQKAGGVDGREVPIPTVKTAPSIFTKIASFFSSSPKLEGEKKAEVVTELEPKIVKPMRDSDLSTPSTAKADVETEKPSADVKKSQGLDVKPSHNVAVTKRVKDVAQAAQPKARSEKIAGNSDEQPVKKSASLLDKITGFFSSKPVKTAQIKPDLAPEIAPSLKTAQIESGHKIGNLDRSQHPSDFETDRVNNNNREESSVEPVTDNVRGSAAEEGLETMTEMKSPVISSKASLKTKRKVRGRTVRSYKRASSLKKRVKKSVRRTKARHAKVRKARMRRVKIQRVKIQRAKIQRVRAQRVKVQRVKLQRVKRQQAKRPLRARKIQRASSQKRRSLQTKKRASVRHRKSGIKLRAAVSQRAGYVQAPASAKNGGRQATQLKAVYAQRHQKRIVIRQQRRKAAYQARRGQHLKRQIRARKKVKYYPQKPQKQVFVRNQPRVRTYRRPQQACVSCERCRTCTPRKGQFRLKHHLREYY